MHSYTASSLNLNLIATPINSPLGLSTIIDAILFAKSQSTSLAIL